jgi:ribose transport system permease protein
MSDTTSAPLPARFRFNTVLRYVGVVPILVMIVVGAMAFIEPRFFAKLNILNVLRNFSFLSIIALGQMLVMIVGGFDLSVGAIAALASIVTAICMGAVAAAMPDAIVLICVLGVGAALLAGTAVGLVNGLIVGRLGVAPFMATLGMTSVVLGIAFYMTKGVPIYGMPEAFTDIIGREKFLELAYPVWIALGIILLLVFVLDRTKLGRHIYAVGGNLRAARASGIRVLPMLLVAYGAAGFLAALVGVLMTARIGSGQSTLGGTLAIESIAAAVVGGVSLRGGVGRVHRVVMAALFLSVLSNVLNLAKVDSKFQTMALGLAVLIAALAEARLRKETADD